MMDALTAMEKHLKAWQGRDHYRKQQTEAFKAGYQRAIKESIDENDVLRRALSELCSIHDEPAGVTMSQVANRQEFSKIMDAIDERVNSTVARARSLLRDRNEWKERALYYERTNGEQAKLLNDAILTRSIREGF